MCGRELKAYPKLTLTFCSYKIEKRKKVIILSDSAQQMIYLMVVVLVRDALAEAAPEAPAEEAPAFFSNTFQNLSDSSAAAVASI